MISLRQIQYALAVAKHAQFKKAADACAVSQSALSTALAEMEKQLGYQIFERSNKQVLITPLGRQTLRLAQEIKLRMDDLKRLGESQRDPLTTSLALGIIPTICPFLLPIVLPGLQRQYPALRLRVSEEQSRALVEQVRTGDLDAAVLALPFNCEGLLTFRFWAENFYWITQADDDLASKPRLENEEMDPQRLMLLKEGHCLKDHALAVCHLQEISEQSLSATSLNTLVQLVANGFGTTLVPEMALPQLVAPNPRIAKVPLAEPGPHREIAFIVRPNYPSLGNIELLMQLFRRELEETRSTPPLSSKPV